MNAANITLPGWRGLREGTESSATCSETAPCGLKWHALRRSCAGRPRSSLPSGERARRLPMSRRSPSGSRYRARFGMVTGTRGYAARTACQSPKYQASSSWMAMRFRTRRAVPAASIARDASFSSALSAPQSSLSRSVTTRMREVSGSHREIGAQPRRELGQQNPACLDASRFRKDTLVSNFGRTPRSASIDRSSTSASTSGSPTPRWPSSQRCAPWCRRPPAARRR